MRGLVREWRILFVLVLLAVIAAAALAGAAFHTIPAAGRRLDGVEHNAMPRLHGEVRAQRASNHEGEEA